MNPFANGIGAHMAGTTKAAARAPKKGAHLERARALGLIGCIDGPPDLAENYKKHLRKILRAKYRPR